jgi:dipeptidyl aminopeptidase/acylaminoacyl peptidase
MLICVEEFALNWRVLLTAAIVNLLASSVQGKGDDAVSMYYRYFQIPQYVAGGIVEPRWLGDGSFWYARRGMESIDYRHCDPKAGSVETLTTKAEITAALETRLGRPLSAGTALEVTDFDPASRSLGVRSGDNSYRFDLRSASVREEVTEPETLHALEPRVLREAELGYMEPVREIPSPDKSVLATVVDNQLALRTKEGEPPRLLTDDGITDFAYSLEAAHWSPDGQRIAVKKIDERGAPEIPIVDWLSRRESVSFKKRWRAGDPLPKPQIWVVAVPSGFKTRIDTGTDAEHYLEIVGWRGDGSEVLFTRTERDFHTLKLMAGNPLTGESRVLLTEYSETFVYGWQVIYPNWIRDKGNLTWLSDGRRFLWMSERDGWNHLYLYDVEAGLIGQLTRGQFPVETVVNVDEKRSVVYFMARGDETRPYGTYFHRVGLDGKGQRRLTNAPGDHQIALSPTHEFFVDVHSSAEQPPRSALHSMDGTIAMPLEAASQERLENAMNWSPPEVFTVKAADGETDIYGVLYKPWNFDPSRTYPVVDWIYAGPISTAMEYLRGYWDFPVGHGFAQLGFVFLQVDGRGTTGRGKSFNDLVYGQFGRIEIPDHVAALRQVAEARPYMDMNRVGILGASWGGYFAIRGMLFAPSVYHVASAHAPVESGYTMGRAIEAYLGLPWENREAYDFSSIAAFVDRLEGRLMLIHGTSDDDAAFGDTMKIAAALRRAGKPYDMRIMPGLGHLVEGSEMRVSLRYLQEHLRAGTPLIGVEVR